MSQFPDIHRYRLTAGTQDEDPSGRRQPWNAKLSRNTKMKIHAINLPLLSLDVWLWVSFCRTLAMSQQSCIRPSLKVVIDLAHGLRLCECCQSRARMGLSIARLRARALRRQNCLDRIGFPVHEHLWIAWTTWDSSLHTITSDWLPCIDTAMVLRDDVFGIVWLIASNRYDVWWSMHITVSTRKHREARVTFVRA